MKTLTAANLTPVSHSFPAGMSLLEPIATTHDKIVEALGMDWNDDAAPSVKYGHTLHFKIVDVPDEYYSIYSANGVYRIGGLRKGPHFEAIKTLLTK